MEFHNPITEMTDFIGRWNGTIESDEIKLPSSIEFNHHGSDIIQYKQIINTENKDKIIEIGYFFFNKLKEELKHIVVNEEGYIEINNMILSKKSKYLKIASTFDFGYNLPPNMKIKREFKLLLNENLIEISLKMGKDAKTISEAAYRKKRRNCSI
jgi:hypothetical protein